MSQCEWFAVRVRSNFEKPVSLALRNKGYEEYLPLYHRRRNYNGHVRQAELPLFPGYVFSQFDINLRLPILVIPGVLHVLGIGNTPLPVDPAELEAVKAVLSSGLGAEPWPFVKVGQRVLLERGPLRGLEGIITEAKRGYRLIVSVTLLQRSVSVEIDREWVRCIGQSREIRSPHAPSLAYA